MNFLFVCGGSAGHINPALAIAEELKRRAPESEILFAGADKILEKRLVPEAGFRLVNIKMSGLRRGVSPQDVLHNIKTAYNLFTANFKSGKLLKNYKPDAVIGTGGYICYPVLKKAKKLGIPAYVLEPNAYPGLAVRMLSAHVDKVFVTYKGLEERYKRPDRVVYTGTPLRSEFCLSDADEVGSTSKESLNNEKPLVVSYWGSLGAAGMNCKILDFIKRNVNEHKFNHIHATGVSGSVEKMKKNLEDIGVPEAKAPFADIREYIYDMSSVMKSADIVLARAGASTIAEITSMGKPAVLVPSPNVTENHQEENARQLQLAGGAVMILENECTGDTLYSTVTSILDSKTELERMSKAQKSLSVPDAAARIVELVINDCTKNRNVGVNGHGRI